MKKSVWLVVIVAALTGPLVGLLWRYLRQAPVEHVPDAGRVVLEERETSRSLLPPDTLRQAITAMAAYLHRANLPSGQFIYRINLDASLAIQERYNLLRHAGAMYALGMYHERHPNQTTREVMTRAATFLRACCIQPLPERPELLAVWSPPEITYNNSPMEAKLGGAGLGLVALVSLEKMQPGSVPIDELRRLGQFIAFLQRGDGGFYSKYIPSKGGPQGEWESLYYPGEAALGLLMLYELDASPQWVEMAARAIGYLAESRKDELQPPADHWALLATARLLPHYDMLTLPVPREAVLWHALQICRSLLEEGQEVASIQQDPIFQGGFVLDGRTTPTATRLEGLLAALTFLPLEEDALRQDIQRAADSGVNFLLRAMVQRGEHAGAMPRAIRRLQQGEPDYSSSFNQRTTEVRIDYVQHALSAFLQYDRTTHAKVTLD